jgi:DNA-binding protein H-NS
VARLQELLAKKATLDREIADTQRKERSAAIAHIQTLMDQYGLTVGDLGGKVAAVKGRRGRPPGAKSLAKAADKAVGKPAKAAKAGKGKSSMKGKKVAAKFRNKATGETWSGRGLKPRWLSAAIDAGKKLTDFAV